MRYADVRPHEHRATSGPSLPPPPMGTYTQRMDDTLHPWTGRAILHVDMDAFFATVEQLDHPEWRGRPVIVGGSAEGRGVVSAASYEARAFGVRSAMPSAQAARLCPDAVWAPPHFSRYRELSRVVHAIFETFTPYVQPVSIDEAFLDLTPGPHGHDEPTRAATSIQMRIDDLGLSCSVGVATSKTVAKIASDRDKPHGITVVRPGEEAAFLAPLPVTALSGIGARTAERLRGAGLHTLGDVAALDEASAAQLIGAWGPELVLRARGIDESPVRPTREVKSVSHEHTFAQDVRDRQAVEAAVRSLTAKVAARLRRGGLAGRTVTLKLRYADFTTRSASRTLPVATDLEADIAETALGLLRATWTAGAGLRLIGVGVSGFTEPAEQLGLLQSEESVVHARSRALTQSVDAVRERFGEDSIVFGGEGLQTSAATGEASEDDES